MLAEHRSRIPSLDGLRAISVVLVLVSHLAGTHRFPVGAQLLDDLDPGALGVRVFFVISGFLISRILFDEIAATGGVRLSRFYFRRTLRIFPPYYVFLAAIAAMMWLGLLQLPTRDVLAALTYSANYLPTRAWKLSHTWSLAVEEHFYLLWPVVLAWLGRSRGLLVPAALVVVAPVLRVAYWLFAPGLEIPVRTETIADAIAVGCLLAGARETLHARDWYRRFLASRATLALPLVILAAHALQFLRPLDFALGYTVANVAIALAIDRVVTYPDDRVGRFLNSSTMVTIGLISYSIYVWQELFLDRYCSRSVCAFPVNVVLALMAAVASYVVVERPSLALRKRLETRLFGRRVSRKAGREARETVIAPPVALHGAPPALPATSADSYADAAGPAPAPRTPLATS